MNDFNALRDRVIALRRAGTSRRQIKEELQLGSNWELNRLLSGEPPAEWTRRPNAKDDLRVKARELRAEGWTYRDVARALGVSLSSCSLWLRDMPAPSSRDGEYDQERVAAMWRERWERLLRQREVQRQQAKFAASKEVGDLTRRDLLMSGALVYWCEGAKDKQYERREKVKFINSDSNLIRFFLRFLDGAGVERERLRFRVHIHETADIDEAGRYWAGVAGTDAVALEKPVIKRHSPRTNRRNISAGYRGCLEVSVLSSAELYRQIEGWAFGAMLGHVIEEPACEQASGLGEELPAPLRDWLTHHREASS